MVVLELFGKVWSESDGTQKNSTRLRIILAFRVSLDLDLDLELDLQSSVFHGIGTRSLTEGIVPSGIVGSNSHKRSHVSFEVRMRPQSGYECRKFYKTHVV